ncbi:MAG: 50S ribosomal protein L23, partial [Spirochaetales bacterium]|nr:50S ribosomal protein L23 [Spirochaetales bacterium]
MRADQIIIEPILSEKTNLAREGEVKKYTFKV